jgi:hypothetical protein
LGGIPSNYTVDLDLVSPVDLMGIPSSFDITSLPKIQIALDHITIEPITLKPLDVNVHVKEIPSIRTHIPAAFTVGFSVLGLQVASIRLCGEAQVITEPYVPNPCEHCGGGVILPPALVPEPTTHEPPTSVPTIAVARRRRGK